MRNNSPPPTIRPTEYATTAPVSAIAARVTRRLALRMEFAAIRECETISVFSPGYSINVSHMKILRQKKPFGGYEIGAHQHKSDLATRSTQCLGDFQQWLWQAEHLLPLRVRSQIPADDQNPLVPVCSEMRILGIL